MATVILETVDPSVDSSGLTRCRRHEALVWICVMFGEESKWNAGPWMEMDADHQLVRLEGTTWLSLFWGLEKAASFLKSQKWKQPWPSWRGLGGLQNGSNVY
jgi:hypothetical protein